MTQFKRYLTVGLTSLTLALAPFGLSGFNHVSADPNPTKGINFPMMAAATPFKDEGYSQEWHGTDQNVAFQLYCSEAIDGGKGEIGVGVYLQRKEGDDWKDSGGKIQMDCHGIDKLATIDGGNDEKPAFTKEIFDDKLYRLKFDGPNGDKGFKVRYSINQNGQSAPETKKTEETVKFLDDKKTSRNWVSTGKKVKITYTYDITNNPDKNHSVDIILLKDGKEVARNKDLPTTSKEKSADIYFDKNLFVKGVTYSLKFDGSGDTDKNEDKKHQIKYTVAEVEDNVGPIVQDDITFDPTGNSKNWTATKPKANVTITYDYQHEPDGKKPLDVILIKGNEEKGKQQIVPTGRFTTQTFSFDTEPGATYQLKFSGETVNGGDHRIKYQVIEADAAPAPASAPKTDPQQLSPQPEQQPTPGDNPNPNANPDTSKSGQYVQTSTDAGFDLRKEPKIDESAKFNPWVTLKSGTPVTVKCQVPDGDEVSGRFGTTKLWDYVEVLDGDHKGKKGYVSDSYVYTGKNGQIAKTCTPEDTK
ncbi:hypothetical protein SAMN05444392_105206 [Seinonella peptonophila]|uniref:SH3 domain-containing protein n=1 Tax=Seinonella peptonophila TaxID=112248 RepID=A0A1M4XVN5_9BACL|nr:hypothetical protein [Seinonella peptonophila]SHE97485.1 hypothetical protein SAMN05444392_105206 [Seinonella peptonophila]